MSTVITVFTLIALFGDDIRVMYYTLEDDATF